LAIEKLKGHKTPGIDQIPAEMINHHYRTSLFPCQSVYQFVYSLTDSDMRYYLPAVHTGHLPI
jgi:hypothetical protein